MPAVLKRAFSAMAKRWKTVGRILEIIFLVLALGLLTLLFHPLHISVAAPVVTAILFVTASAFPILLLWQFPKMASALHRRSGLEGLF